MYFFYIYLFPPSSRVLGLSFSAIFRVPFVFFCCFSVGVFLAPLTPLLCVSHASLPRLFCVIPAPFSPLSSLLSCIFSASFSRVSRVFFSAPSSPFSFWLSWAGGPPSGVLRTVCFGLCALPLQTFSGPSRLLPLGLSKAPVLPSCLLFWDVPCSSCVLLFPLCTPALQCLSGSLPRACWGLLRASSGPSHGSSRAISDPSQGHLWPHPVLSLGQFGAILGHCLATSWLSLGPCGAISGPSRGLLRAISSLARAFSGPSQDIFWGASSGHLWALPGSSPDLLRAQSGLTLGPLRAYSGPSRGHVRAHPGPLQGHPLAFSCPPLSLSRAMSWPFRGHPKASSGPAPAPLGAISGPTQGHVALISGPTQDRLRSRSGPAQGPLRALTGSS
jgi:hypothetical protein